MIIFNIFNKLKAGCRYLWLSVSSVKFYTDIFRRCDNYGISYITNIALIAALICTVGFFLKINELEKAFKYDANTDLAKNIEDILKQIPDLNFYAGEITDQYDNPLIVKNVASQLILAIDPQNKLLPRDREKLPLTITKDTLIIKLPGSNNSTPMTIPVELTQLFGHKNLIITYDLVKQLIINMLGHLYRLFTYIIFPIMTIAIILNSFLDKVLLVVVIFLATRLSKENKIKMKDIIRVIMYSSGAFALFQPIISLFFIKYQFVIWLVQSWTNILVVLAFLTITNRIKPLKW